MSKNTRWALAIVGVLIIIVAGVVVGTGREETDATPAQEQSADPTAPAGDEPVDGVTGSSGDVGDDQGRTPDASGGAAPGGGNSDNSGGAGPRNETGGAAADSAVVSPVLVAGKEPTIKAKKGDIVVLRARSDNATTLHLHGYDKTLDLKPGKIGRLRFKATIDGEFEVALHVHGGDVHVGKLRVNP